MQRLLLSAAFIAAVSATALAQTSAPESSETKSSGFASGLEVRDALSTWRADHGANWLSIFAGDTGYSRFVYGGSTAAPFTPYTDADFETLGRLYLDEAYDLMGISTGQLELDSVDFLPLGLIGTTDKTSVQFQQFVNGVPVDRGFVNALFNQSGQLLSLDTVGLPDSVLPSNATPTITAERAERFAVQVFQDETGLEALDISVDGLVIAQDETAKLRTGALAWKVRVGNETEGEEPKASMYSISAQGALRVIRSDNEIHFFDVGGNVKSLVTTGELPDLPGNPPVALPAGYMRITSAAGTVFSNADGNFNFPGVTGPLNVTFTYNGTFNNVDNDNGGEYSKTVSLATGTGNSVFLNQPASAQITSQATPFNAINQMRDWTRGINPTDSMADFVANANVNINSTCNAFFNGSSTNYYLAGGGCAATSYDNVVWHEMGHWMNVNYGSGNGSDGFGEGNADVFAMFQSDSPIIGKDFCGSGCNIRTGLNSRQFCGDSSPGCYGQVHADGEVLMGAMWKLRERLNTTLGGAAGDFTADLLFNSWMNAYNDGQIKTIIEEHWLVLDDNDGDIGNGTPNHGDIDGGFKDQGFPGHKLSFVSIANVTEPVDTQDENGPYGVSAVITPVTGTAITSATLVYIVNGGFPQIVPLTQATANRWHATIPGQSSPNKIEWYMTADNDLGQSQSYPSDAPTEMAKFEIGTLQVFHFEDFEGGSDNGWTHAQVATQDDWQRGTPVGAAGDPGSAYSGANIWANDLGLSGWNGIYQPNVNNYLLSPNINLAGSSGAKLVYQRWLTVEEGIFDNAEISINGNKVWNNPANGNLIDSAWLEHEVDISAYDGQTVQVEYRLKSDGGLEFGGWNIDDFSIQTQGLSPTVGLPTHYGSGTVGSTIPTIDSLGQIPSIGNNDFAVALKSAPSETTAFVAFGFSQLSLPLLGITQLVLPGTIFTGTTDLFGQYIVSMPVPNDPMFIGLSVYFQSLVVDAGGPSGFSATNGLHAIVQP